MIHFHSIRARSSRASSSVPATIPLMPSPIFTLKRHPRSRGIRIRICADGSCTVTAPRRVPVWMINKLVEQKSEWILDHIAKAKSRPVSLLRGGTKEDYARLKDRAMELVNTRLQHFNTFYQLSYKRISIRNQKTRWGSCSNTGTLCFNYRIALLPPEASDYIVVHELCHLAHMNHSARFWGLVAKAVPEYKRIRAEMRNVDKLVSKKPLKKRKITPL